MIHELTIDRCEACTGPLPARAPRGRRRRYCSGRCRTAASRARRAHAGTPDGADVAGEGAEPVEAFLRGHSASTDDQVLGVLHEALLLAATYRRLGAEARPPFAWRCSSMADVIDAAILRFFKV